MFFTLSSFCLLPITWTCHMPNGQYLLLFPGLLSVLFVILAWRRVLPGATAPAAAAERWAVPALCVTCAQVCVTARAQQIYLLIAWERAGSPVWALPYLCSRSDTSQVQCIENQLRGLCDTGACFPKICFPLENLEYEYESQTFTELLCERGILCKDTMRGISQQQQLRNWAQAITQIQRQKEKYLWRAWEPLWRTVMSCFLESLERY